MLLVSTILSTNMKVAVLILCGLFAIAKGRTIDADSVYKPRVVNGENAELGERPFQISMFANKRFRCGGSILDEYWVLTAAHCVEGESASDFQINAGTIDLNEPHDSRQVEKIIVHDGFAPDDSYKNDIALMKVVTPFEFSWRIQPVALPESHAKVQANSEVVVSGWGRTDFSNSADVLQKATVYITDPEVCQAAVQERGYTIHPTQVCANDPTIRRGECNGDSGGPVTVDGVLTGIVSWSIKDPDCGSTKFPGVHTRVSEYIDWIRENTK